MFRNLANYALCIALAVLLCVFVSGLGGLFILILLVLTLIFSLVIIFVSKKTVSVSTKLSTEIANKGEDVELEITIAKSTFLPTSYIEITLDMTPNITTGHLKTFKVISARRTGDIITVPLKTEFCGEATVLLADVRLIDYLGIVNMKLAGADDVSMRAAVRIMPQIRDAGVQADVLKATSENAAAYEEDEEESNESAIGLTGVAGYEHRKYEIGDPLKRVNWKLSSKRDELMVRLDDKVLSSSQSFILDYPLVTVPDRAYYQNVDMIIEASLSLLSMLLMQGYESSYTYYLGGWQTVDINDEKGLLYLQEELAGIRPTPERERNEAVLEADSSVICFTCCTANMSQEIAAFYKSKGCSLVVTEQSGISKICTNMWKITEDLEFVAM